MGIQPQLASLTGDDDFESDEVIEHVLLACFGVGGL
jgi:hypothetical protein